MKLLTASRYYALNDRTIHMLSKGEVDMSATTGVVFGFASMAAAGNVSDAAVEELLDSETEVEIFVADKNITRAGGAFFKYLNLTLFNLEKYGLFKHLDRNNYKHNCLYLALQAGGLSDINLQHLILILRNRTTYS